MSYIYDTNSFLRYYLLVNNLHTSINAPVMNYEEFQRQLGKAGLTLSQFAELVKMNRISLSNYAKRGCVPSHLAIIASLLGEMAEQNLDYRSVLAKIDISTKKPRGAGAIGKFGGNPQSHVNIQSLSTSATELAQKNTNVKVNNSNNKSFEMLASLKNNGPASNKPKSIRKKKNTVVSLFSGCGGMDLGFKGGFKFLEKSYSKNPFDLIWANELNEAACRTYRKNIGSHIHAGDVWGLIDRLPSAADVIIGGFPCQDISVNGKGAGISGKRSGLYMAMVEAVARIRPRLFVAENVKGLLMKHHAKALKTVLADFSALGYEVSYSLYNAADYGVPQTRERVIIIGRLPEETPVEIPAKILNPNSYVTAKRAIQDLADLSEDDSINHIWSRANRSPDQGDRRLKADRPGYTIRAECHGNIQWHYELPRRISMREAARIQSFPDDFHFDSKLRETERQVGNAVPPVLAWHIAKSIGKSLS